VGTAARIVAIGFAVSLLGDACHVTSGTTRYLWDGVPELFHSAIWFPFVVAGGVLGLGAAEYAAGSDGLLGVAPWLTGLYFAAGAVAYRLWDALER
jgi:hypothetical protein